MPLVKRVLLILFLLLFLLAKKVSASCEVTSTSYYLSPNTPVDVTVSLKNTGTNPITWFQIPINYASVVTIISHSLQESGWTLTENPDSYVYTNNSLNSGDSVHLNVTFQTGDERPVDLSWFSSENASGDPVDTCSPLSFSITNSPPPSPTPTPIPNIVNTQLSVSNSSATLTWTTDQTATGLVSYGLTSGYGYSKTTSSGTSHSASLTSLSPSTTYHYQIQVTGEGGTNSSADATFTTSAADVVTTTTTTVNTVTIITPTPTPKPVVDTTPPSTTIKTDFSKPFTQSPTITGVTTDYGANNVGVASISYSLDNGKNWTPVDSIQNVGKKTTSFDFTPSKLDDGNYTIKIKSTDLSGNTGYSKAYTLIIDRLPPEVGGSLFSVGPMILKPSANGAIYTIVGFPLKVTVSAVGGPTTMDLFLSNQSIPLNKNIENGLWNGILNIDSQGNFPINIKSVDGANNKTSRDLSRIVSLPAGTVVDTQNKPISNASVKIYVFEKNQNDFVLWDSQPYLQSNPQTTNNQGEYRKILPTGKYFIEVSAPGKQTQRTEIFELDVNSPVNQQFILKNASFFENFYAKTIKFYRSTDETRSKQSGILVGKSIPEFNLSSLDFPFSNTSILGKPTIISFVSTWEPQTSDQLNSLEKFKLKNDGVNTIAVVTQESVSKVNIFKKTGGYSIPIVADPDGILVLPLNIQSLPTHIFIDRKGIIKEAVVGFLNDTELLNEILK